jgi:hypothetical protein
MKGTLLVTGILAMFSIALADVTATCGWEGSATILGSFGGVTATIATDPVYAGSQSLRLEREGSSTPQAYIAWITGLSNGDVVTASFWRYDVTPAAAPSCRIWAHWNDDPNDVNGYNGSAGGNSEYGPGTGWDLAEHSWEVIDGHTGLVIEARVYSNPGDVVWIDDLTVTAPDGSVIIVPEDGQVLYGRTWATIKASF